MIQTSPTRHTVYSANNTDQADDPTLQALLKEVEYLNLRSFRCNCQRLDCWQCHWQRLGCPRSQNFIKPLDDSKTLVSLPCGNDDCGACNYRLILTAASRTLARWQALWGKDVLLDLTTLTFRTKRATESWEDYIHRRRTTWPSYEEAAHFYRTYFEDVKNADELKRLVRTVPSPDLPIARSTWDSRLWGLYRTAIFKDYRQRYKRTHGVKAEYDTQMEPTRQIVPHYHISSPTEQAGEIDLQIMREVILSIDADADPDHAGIHLRTLRLDRADPASLAMYLAKYTHDFFKQHLHVPEGRRLRRRSSTLQGAFYSSHPESFAWCSTCPPGNASSTCNEAHPANVDFLDRADVNATRSLAASRERDGKPIEDELRETLLQHGHQMARRLIRFVYGNVKQLSTEEVQDAAKAANDRRPQPLLIQFRGQEPLKTTRPPPAERTHWRPGRRPGLPAEAAALATA